MSEATTAAATEEKNEYYVEFKKPYKFEGKEYAGIDLSGVAELKIKDLAEVQKQLQNGGEAAASLLMETTTAFIYTIAARATQKPVEFFKRMPVKKIEAVRETVMKAINTKVDETESPQLLKLNAPYIYEGARDDIRGKSYTEVSFDNAGNITAMDKAAAENKMALAGQPVTGIARNYVYSCYIAARAANLPEDFFLNLPACEGMKLLLVLNGDGFFE